MYHIVETLYDLYKHRGPLLQDHIEQVLLLYILFLLKVQLMNFFYQEKIPLEIFLLFLHLFVCFLNIL